MSTVAYLNGEFLSAGQVPQVAVTDTGFVMGATVAEQVRTCQGRPFHLDQHLQRLMHGLELIGLPSPLSFDDWKKVVEQVVQHNHALQDPADDLGVTLFVTPGIYSAYASDLDEPQATYGVHTYPLPFRLWHSRYVSGYSLQSVSVQQVSPHCWPPALKCRSRMHYYLASREARQRRPGSMAILLDEQAQVTETPTANIVAHLPGHGLVSPARDQILPGISLAVLAEIAERLRIPFTYQRLRVEDLQAASEVMVTSTPFCVLPVSDVDGQPLPTDRPLYQQILSAWNERMGLDLAIQADRFCRR